MEATPRPGKEGKQYGRDHQAKSERPPSLRPSAQGPQERPLTNLTLRHAIHPLEHRIERHDGTPATAHAAGTPARLVRSNASFYALCQDARYSMESFRPC
jgi:hypothetical protein